MKKLAIALMVLGVIGIGVGGAMYASSDQQKYCEQFRAKALALADQAVKAEGTPQAQELMDQSQSETEMADQTCASADGIRQQCLLIAGAGFVLLVVGFVLSRRKPAPPPAA